MSEMYVKITINNGSDMVDVGRLLRDLSNNTVVEELEFEVD